MDHIRNIYRKVTLFMVAVLFITICTTYIYFIINTGRVYEEHAVESILDVKKDFLKSIIDNLILEIEFEEAKEKEHYKKWTNNTSQILQKYYERSPENFIDLFISFCNTGGNRELLSVLIRDIKFNHVIYKSGIFIGKNPVKEDFSSYFQDNYGDYEISFGVSNDYIDKSTKEKIASRIRNREYSQNSYIWVNEIKDYNGGEDYAIRVVHPNLPETEGQCLSSDIKDIRGNYPYATELEGVKKDGEVFLTTILRKRIVLLFQKR